MSRDEFRSAVMIIALLSGTAPAVLRADEAKADKPEKPAAKADPRAMALMDEAIRNRYMWSPSVTGVSGKFVYEADGRRAEGSFNSVLRKRGGLTITVDKVTDLPSATPDPKAAAPADAVKGHIGSLILHRTPAPAGAPARAQDPMTVVVEDEERGPLLLVLGDPLASSYRVKDGRLVQVNRHMGEQRFSIDVTGFATVSDGRGFTTAYTITWWDAVTGKRAERQTYTADGLFDQGGQVFPKSEKVVTEKDGKTTVMTMRYSDVKFETAGKDGAK